MRPTPDRVRETVFNWLAGRIEGARCLDLFAGSGVLGIEALSRGARETWFVEGEYTLAQALREHAESLHANARVFNEPVERFLDEADGAGRFDVVFLDPPYAVQVAPVLERLPALLADHGTIYLERPASAGLPESAAFEWKKSARAGAVCYGLAEIRRGRTGA